MERILNHVQPAVKKETGRVMMMTGIGVILMWVVFGILHLFMPGKVPFDYSQRTLLQMLWVIIAIVAPCFHFVAGIVPLLFPGTGIKIAGIFHTKK